MTNLRDLLNDFAKELRSRDLEREPGKPAYDEMVENLVDECIETIKARLIG